MPIYSRLTFLSAYLIGGLFWNFIPLSNVHTFGGSLKRVLAFALLSLFSLSLRVVIRRDFLESHDQGSKSLKALNVLAATIGFLFSLELFRYYSGAYPLYLVLLVVLLQLVELFWRKHIAIAWLSGALAIWGIAVLSIWSVVGAISWDVAFVALSLACSLASLSFLCSGFSRDLMNRFYPILMPLGPLILGAFPLFGLAPRIYCVILVIVVMAQTLVGILKSGGRLEWVRREATGVCYLFIVMLLLLRLI